MELIKVTEQNGEQLVSARELHEFLEVGRDFTNWIKGRIDKYGFEEGKDYSPILANLVESTPRARMDYILKLDMAKEISMVENNEKGMQARRYFIECEKKLKNQIKVPTTLKEALLLALQQQEQIEQQQLLIESQKPKVEFYDEIIDSKDTIDIGQLAKTLNIKNIGRNKLFEILRDKSILDRRNQPYQTFIDRGYFKTIETSYVQGGDVKIHIKTVVYQKGVDYIRKLLKEVD